MEPQLTARAGLVLHSLIVKVKINVCLSSIVLHGIAKSYINKTLNSTSLHTVFIQDVFILLKFSLQLVDLPNTTLTVLAFSSSFLSIVGKYLIYLIHSSWFTIIKILVGLDYSNHLIARITLNFPFQNQFVFKITQWVHLNKKGVLTFFFSFHHFPGKSSTIYVAEEMVIKTTAKFKN